MQDLLTNPAIQAGIIPFIAAFIVAMLLSRLNEWIGLAVVAGLLSLVMITTGIEFSPLTSTRKIVLITLLIPVVALILHLTKPTVKIVRPLMAVIAVAPVLWLVWPYLMRQETIDMLTVGVGLSIFGLWLVTSFVSLNGVNVLATGAAVAATGFGVGGAALLGASALLGQMGISIGVSGLAVLAAFVLIGRYPKSGYMLTIIPGVLLALIATSGVIYARMPWYTLIAIAAIPLLSKIGLSNDQKPWLRAAIWFGICMVPALVAIGLSWKAEGDVPF